MTWRGLATDDSLLRIDSSGSRSVKVKINRKTYGLRELILESDSLLPLRRSIRASVSGSVGQLSSIPVNEDTTLSLSYPRKYDSTTSELASAWYGHPKKDTENIQYFRRNQILYPWTLCEPVNRNYKKQLEAQTYPPHKFDFLIAKYCPLLIFDISSSTKYCFRLLLHWPLKYQIHPWQRLWQHVETHVRDTTWVMP